MPHDKDMKFGKFFSHKVSLGRVFAASTLTATILAAGATMKIGTEIKTDLEASLPAPKAYKLRKAPRITKLLSSDGKLVATLFKEHRRDLSIHKMGDHIVKAIVAIEDARFYEHSGVDYRGVARAAVANYRSGEVEQGASTLTMQLARKLYLSNEKSYERKIKEALLARRLERRMTKRQILEAYLNEAYFGAGAYGIAAASNRYFETTPEKLSLAQAALLAGLVQAPTSLNPIDNPQAAKHRQILVLKRMRDLEFITNEEHQAALDETLEMSFERLKPGTKRPMLKYPYFTSYTIRSLADEVGEDELYQGGLVVKTSLDRNAQNRMRSILRTQIAKYGPQYGIGNGAAVLIENKSGEIRAMVGGTDWSSKDRFNRAWQATRQPGSTFKPFLYASALRQGYGQETLVNDDKTTYIVGRNEKKWTPMNSDHRDLGEIPLREALRLSRNQAAVSLVADIGIGPIIQVAKLCGIQSELPRVPAIGLGAGEVTPLEMANAYSTIAKGGVAKPSTALRSARTWDGKTVINGKSRWSHLALSPKNAATLTDMMARVVRSGTGRAALLPGLQVAGKTGTTDQFRDAWFVGFTPKYTLAVWMGNDDNSPTNRAYGGGLPAQTWKKMMLAVDQGDEKTFSHLMDNPTKRKYCKESHRLATDDCDTTYREVFYAPTQKPEECDECDPDAQEDEFTKAFQISVQPSYPTADKKDQ